MPFFFLDTSALAKRYLPEPGSHWVTQITTPGLGNICCVSNITPVEMIAAIYRRVRMGRATSAEGQQAVTRFLAEYQHNFRRVAVISGVIDHACHLAAQHPLRGYDAVQLACALNWQQKRIQGQMPPLTFVCADANLNAAAASEGLLVDDPNLHP